MKNKMCVCECRKEKINAFYRSIIEGKKKNQCLLSEVSRLKVILQHFIRNAIHAYAFKE